MAVVRTAIFLISLTAATAATAAEDAAHLAVGLPVDKLGGPTIDPTKNVIDLVLAAIKRIDDLSAAQARLEEAHRQSDAKYQDALREAETRRVNELAAQKQAFDSELARGIRANQDSSALLLAGQVRELKTDTSDRIGKLEVFANEQRGRSSATDPASVQLANDVSRLKTTMENNSGQWSGASNLWMLLIGLAGLIFGVGALALRSHGSHENESFARRERRSESSSDALFAELLRELQARRT